MHLRFIHSQPQRARAARSALPLSVAPRRLTSAGSGDQCNTQTLPAASGWALHLRACRAVEYDALSTPLSIACRLGHSFERSASACTRTSAPKPNRAAIDAGASVLRAPSQREVPILEPERDCHSETEWPLCWCIGARERSSLIIRKPPASAAWVHVFRAGEAGG